MRRVLRTAAVLLAVAVALSAAALGALYYYNQPTGTVPEEGAVYEVEQGQTLTSVSRQLEERGLIRSRFLMIGLSKLQDTGGAIKSGYYRLEPGMSTVQVHEFLVEGSQTLHRVTIPEGLTISKVAARLEEQGICDARAFTEAANSAQELEGLSEYPIPEDLSKLEGFLFPDTYLFQRDFPAEKVVTHMVDTFFGQLEEIAPDYRQLSPEELYRTVTIASIVEREYRAAEEAKKIASVFYNRMRRGMMLQSCATVVYVLTEQRGREHPRKLSFDDLEVQSEYNTYTRGGLPPTPIANPGSVALEAAFHPAQTDYLFFLLKNPEAGQHTFSKTLSEHNEAYRLYIKQ